MRDSERANPPGAPTTPRQAPSTAGAAPAAGCAREARRDGARTSEGPAAVTGGEFRIDRDRIATSPFFARLGGVTQVVSSADAGVLHNRLTHSLKVAQLARTIADQLRHSPGTAALVDKLGGCDPEVTDAAALAHDLGHPPFGHLGEGVLDDIARRRLGLVDGFEGNAQTFRILTTTDVRGPSAVGLDLTAAVRAAVLKYPWARRGEPAEHPCAMPVPPRGAGEPPEAPGTGSAKFSVYLTELHDFAQARAPFTSTLEPWQQTVEASVMDTADDIAYAIHDLQDFHRIGVLQRASVADELERWIRDAAQLAALPEESLGARRGGHGHSLERLRRRLHAKDGWLVDDDAFAHAVRRVRSELADGLLAAAFDGSVQAEQALAEFAERWTRRLADGVVVVESPSVRSGHVTLRAEQWHEVQVLKWVHNQFVLLRADLAVHQRGQAALLGSLVEKLERWVSQAGEWQRLPRRLADLVELAEAEYAELAARRPALLDPGGAAEPGRGIDVAGLAKGRAVIDFVASLTDKQAVGLLDGLEGRSGAAWSESFVL